VPAAVLRGYVEYTARKPDYPTLATPIIQKAVVGAQTILAKFTNASTVPIVTGNTMTLQSTFGSTLAPIDLTFNPLPTPLHATCLVGTTWPKLPFWG
jgi:hypothetical protein